MPPAVPCRTVTNLEHRSRRLSSCVQPHSPCLLRVREHGSKSPIPCVSHPLSECVRLKVPRVLTSRRTRLLPVSLLAASALLAGTVRVGAASPTGSPAAATDSLLDTMQRELKRATTDLAKSDPPPYFLGYTVTDLDATAIIATNGSLIYSLNRRLRMADVMMRVGAVALDNTHGQARAS